MKIFIKINLKSIVTTKIIKFQIILLLQISTYQKKYKIAQLFTKSKSYHNQNLFMGIPRFYRWLKARYPLIRFDLSDKNKQVPIFDHFYIDFNALVYQCIRESNCFLRNKIKPLTFQQIYERVFIYLQGLIEVVNPQDMIFIGFDGVAPRAKINQSRYIFVYVPRDRRFKSSNEEEEYEKVLEEIGVENKEFFQQNSISPGTEFLYDLCANLKNRILKELEQNWKHLKIFYSDCCVPGEGEHKIMDFFRYTAKYGIFSKNTTYCVYSPDADVILLTLSLGIENICLIKEDTSGPLGPNWTATTVYRKAEPKQFEFVMINILREYFEKEFAQILNQVKGSTIQQIIDDLILLMAFVGNDFLPLEFCFTLKDNHIENLFTSYKTYLKENKVFINNRGKIDWDKVYRLLEIGKKFEAKMIDEMLKQKRSRKPKTFVESAGNGNGNKNNGNGNGNGQKGQDMDVPEDIQNFEVQNDSITKGRQKYYKTRFNIDDIKTDPKYQAIIRSYIQGLEFYCEYYFIGLPSWSWYYPYHYTPMLTDVYEYLRKNKVSVQFPPTQPYDPFLALMFMVSLKSAILLPKPIENILRDEKSALRSPIDYFPTEFELDKFESLEYNKRALIQFLDEGQVVKVYKSVQIKAYSEKEILRNKRNNFVLLSFNAKKVQQKEFKLNRSAAMKEQELKLQQQVQQELKSIFKLNNKQKDAITKSRVPTLKIWGNNFELNQEGKIITKNKYKYTGNPGQIVFFNNFLGIIEDADNTNEQLKNAIDIEYSKVGILGKSDFVFTIKRVNFTRQINRFCLTPSRKQVLVPDFAVFKPLNYDYIRKTQMSESQKQYEKGEIVSVLTAKHFGCQGIIEKLEEKTAQVKLIKGPITSSEKIEEFTEQFYTVDYVLDHLNIKYETLIAIMDQLIILPRFNKKQPSLQSLPTGLNFSLNIIDINQRLIVPRFVRCQMEYENSKKPQDIFKKMEISKLALKNLEKYVETFEWLIEYIEDSIEKRSFVFRRPLYAREIFGDYDKPNIKMYQEFIRLYEFDNQGSFYSIYSKIYNTIPQFSYQPIQPETITVRYNQIISRRQAKLAPPALKYEPEYHNIGDKVVLLRNLETGFIVGIDDSIVHVRTGADQRHYRVKFHEVFNEHWSGFLAVEEGKTWNLQCSYFSPTYWKKAIDIQKAEDDDGGDFD